MALSGGLGGLIGTVHTLQLAGILYAAGGVATALLLPGALPTSLPPSPVPES
jgi:hypothetical protein